MIKNFNDLQKKIALCIEQALIETRDEIYEILSKNLDAYYNEPVFDGSNRPEYDRTETLKESLKAGEVKASGNGYSFVVGWEDSYLEFTYPGWENRWGRGLMGVNQATGEDVLQYMARGLHGGEAFSGKHNVWKESIDEILVKYNSIPNILKDKLISAGVPIVGNKTIY